MTAPELLAWQIDDVGNQILKALDGLTSDQLAARVVPGAMSPLETIAHLCEAYEAVTAHLEGRTYVWGSFALTGDSWEGHLGVWRSLRDRAKQLATAGEDATALCRGYEYIVGHDAYHVGQICQLRLHLDPTWDSMAIYG